MMDYNNNKKMCPSSFCGLQIEPEASMWGNGGAWVVKWLAVWESQPQASGVVFLDHVCSGWWNAKHIRSSIYPSSQGREGSAESKNLEIPSRSKVFNISVPSKWWWWDAPDATHCCHCDLQRFGFIKHGRMEMQEADRCRHLYSQPCTFTAVGSG